MRGIASNGNVAPGYRIRPPLRALDRTGPAERETLVRDAEGKIGPGDGQALCCAGCGRQVTTRERAIEVEGAHRHQCANPAGLSFVIGCFATAPGCELTGAPTDYWSWFPPHRWQIALCRGCSAHLGWRFTGAGEFYGLILDRLRDCDAG